MSGVGRVLRAERPDTRIILTEPANAAIVSSGYVNTRNDGHQPTESHPSFEPHPIQGWTPDFIPWVLQEAIDKDYYDQMIPVPGPEGIAWSRRLGGGGRHLHRHFGWFDLRGCHEGGRRGSGRLGNPGDAAGHGRAVSLNAAL